VLDPHKVNHTNNINMEDAEKYTLFLLEIK
jgi:hypothetical protein